MLDLVWEFSVTNRISTDFDGHIEHSSFSQSVGCILRKDTGNVDFVRTAVSLIQKDAIPFLLVKG